MESINSGRNLLFPKTKIKTTAPTPSLSPSHVLSLDRPTATPPHHRSTASHRHHREQPPPPLSTSWYSHQRPTSSSLYLACTAALGEVVLEWCSSHRRRGSGVATIAQPRATPVATVQPSTQLHSSSIQDFGVWKLGIVGIAIKRS